MTADLADWFSHPLTLGLAAVLLLGLFTTLEVLLRSLAEIGNVRFQGMLEDHRRLLPVDGDASVHLSRLLDVLRWLQIVTIGVLWLVLLPQPGIDRALALGLCVAAPVALVILSRTVIGPLGEDSMALLLRLLRPLVWPPVSLLARLKPVPPAPTPEAEDEEASDREIQAYLEAGHAAGIFEREETEFVESLVEFFDTVVREVMTPRTEMVAVPEQASIQEVLETISTSHKSRIPVYQDTVDRVIGVVHVKNLVKYALGESQPQLSAVVHECMVVPENKRLGELLRDFQQGNQQLAIVVDEYGGTSGLVTLEDILEEIVGEIHDEHELAEPPECEEVEPGVYRLLGRASLEVLEEVFGIEVREDDVDTVGGLVFSRHGTVPDPGAEVVDPAHGLTFTVDDVQDRRIVSVTARRLAPDAAAPAGNTPPA